MWFDARKALADLVGGDMPPATPSPATIATVATNPRPALPRVAVVASVAAPQAPKPKGRPRSRRGAACRTTFTLGAAHLRRGSHSAGMGCHSGLAGRSTFAGIWPGDF